MKRETTLELIWESWDYHLREALEKADRIARRMYSEATLCNVPRVKQEEFFTAKTTEMTADIARRRRR